MEALVILILLVSFALLAYRYGYDSGPRLRSHEEELASLGFTVDTDASTIAPDASVQGSPLANRSGYTVASRVA